MKIFKIALVIAVAAVCTLPAAAAPHHHRHHKKTNDGLRLAANIIGLVNKALQPAPRIITTPVVVPVKTLHCPPPPRHHRPAPPPMKHKRFTPHRGHKR